MIVMVAPTAMIGERDGKDRGAGREGFRRPRHASSAGRLVPRTPVRTSPMDRTTSRTSRGMMPTAAMPVPAVKPRPSDLARV